VHQWRVFRRAADFYDLIQMKSFNGPVRHGNPTAPPLLRLETALGERWPFILFLLPALIVIAVAQAWPLASSLVISFYDWSLARSPQPGAFIGFGNYTKALTDGVFIGSVTFTVEFAIASTLLQMSLGLCLALLTVGEGLKLKLTRTLLMLPMVVAPVAVGTMWRMILSARVGPINKGLDSIGIAGPNWLGDPGWAKVSLVFIDAWQWTPFVTIIYTAALTSLPSDVIKAAAVDGASRFQIFRMIVWPMLLPVTILVAMFRFIDALLTLDVIFTTTFGGPGFTTHTLSFWIYQQGLRYFNISYAAATSWLMLLGCVLIATGFLIWRRRVMSWQTVERAR
jgi:multiple sugar transport system permease protein